MKIYDFLMVLLFAACTPNTEDINVKQSEQTWKLVKMSGSFVGSETSGAAMEFQEKINLKSNGTFIKSRVRDGNSQVATGSYTYLEFEDGRYLELSYPSKNSLIGNCTGDLKETYWLIGAKQLKGTWLACDGPGLEYELN